MTPRNLALAVAAPFCWGTAFTLYKPAVNQFPPLFVMLMVYGLIAVVMLLTVKTPVRTPWRSVFLIAACTVPIQGSLLLWGLRGVDATTANLVLQTQVPFGVFLGWLLAGENMNPRKIIGTAIALAGVAIVIGLPEKQPAMIPVLLVAVSGLFWALGQVLARRLSHDEGIVMLKANALMGVPQLALATLLFENGQWQSVVTATPLHWANFAFVAVVGFYFGYIAWFSLLRRVRVDEAIPFILLMTPFGIATAAFVLGESVSMAQILGGAVLLFGLAIVNNVIFSKRPAGSSA